MAPRLVTSFLILLVSLLGKIKTEERNSAYNRLPLLRQATDGNSLLLSRYRNQDLDTAKNSIYPYGLGATSINLLGQGYGGYGLGNLGGLGLGGLPGHGGLGSLSSLGYGGLGNLGYGGLGSLGYGGLGSLGYGLGPLGYGGIGGLGLYNGGLGSFGNIGAYSSLSGLTGLANYINPLGYGGYGITPGAGARSYVNY